MACDKQDAIREYFAMGRHADVDCFYLCQTYTKIPKYLIRDNANVLILFKQDDINLKHVYNDHVNTDMSYENFRELCRCYWQQKYGFVVINKVRLRMDDIEKNLMSMRYLNMVVNTSTTQHFFSNATWITTKNREKIAKQIAKTNELIRKKYRVLKNGKIEEDGIGGTL